MQNIYDQHAKAFRQVAAFVILDKAGERVATVAIKLPADGAGRLWAYTHFLGVQMTRHHADGYGHDKRTPAVCGGFLKAASHRPFTINRNAAPGAQTAEEAYSAALNARLAGFKAALNPHSGEGWERQLERAGFRVLQAV